MCLWKLKQLYVILFISLAFGILDLGRVDSFETFQKELPACTFTFKHGEGFHIYILFLIRTSCGPFKYIGPQTLSFPFPESLRLSLFGAFCVLLPGRPCE